MKILEPGGPSYLGEAPLSILRAKSEEVASLDDLNSPYTTKADPILGCACVRRCLCCTIGPAGPIGPDWARLGRGRAMQPFAFTCPCCGKRVVDLPDLSYDAPNYYPRDPEKQRTLRASLTSDFCTLEDEHFFIRAVCRVPVEDSDQEFGWGIWVSLSAENFRRYKESFHDSDQSKLDHMFGWFCNLLPDYPDTLSLRTTVVPQDGNQRPLVYINDVHADHPLFIEQQNGMPQAKLAKIYAENLCTGEGIETSGGSWSDRLRNLFRH